MSEIKQSKYFLDLQGLTTLWNKIKSTFADKAATENTLSGINTDLGKVKTDVSALSTEIGEVENLTLSLAPKPAKNYSAALVIAGGSTPGIIIDIAEPEDVKITDENGLEKTINYGSGLYIVTSNDPAEIKFLSTSTGSADDSGIDGLNVRVETLERDIIKNAVVTDGSNQLGTFNVSNNSLVIQYDDVLDVDSQSVKALTHRAIAAKFKKLEGALSGIPKFSVEVVTELPTKDVSMSTIYLVKNIANTTTNNLYTEYICLSATQTDDGTVYDWEKLGEQTLAISNMVTKQELNDAISVALRDYMKSTDLKTYIADEISKAQSSILKTVSDNYASKTVVDGLSTTVGTIESSLNNYLLKDDAATTYLAKSDAEKTYLKITDADTKGWLTESQIATSITDGNIGNAIRITDDMITNITNPQL